MVITKKLVLFAIISLCNLLFLYGCIFSPKDVEVIRLPSPDGKVDAVLIQRDAGAMTYAQYLIYVVPNNQKPTEDSTAIFNAKRLFDEKISWHGDRELLIQYTKGDIYHFQNFVYPFSKKPEYVVRIIERQIDDSVKN